MNESTCEACGFNHQTDSCRDQEAIARWRERCAENAERSALGKRIEERRRREIEAPLRAEIDRLRAENDRLRAGRLREETVETARSAIPVLSELAKDSSDDEVCAWCKEALADLDRCYPEEE